MPPVTPLLQLAVPFVWWGAVVAISFLEAPLKFHAPGITIPLGLGIGRLVFRALNAVELALAALFLAAALIGPVPSTTGWGLYAAAAAIVVVQTAVVRPLLDRRALRIVAGESLPRSRQHLVYIGLDVAKVVVLPALGAVLAAGILT